MHSLERGTAMGPHNLEDQMQYTQLNTRVVDSLDVRGIP